MSQYELVGLKICSHPDQWPTNGNDKTPSLVFPREFADINVSLSLEVVEGMIINEVTHELPASYLVSHVIHDERLFNEYNRRLICRRFESEPKPIVVCEWKRRPESQG